MVLSDRSLKEALNSGAIIIKPLDRSNIQPSSIDLKLGKDFLIFKNSKKAYLDPLNDDPADFMERITLSKDEPIIVHPHEFILGTTKEWVEVPDDMVARLEGKSSLGRLGIVIHATAGYVDPGWKGELTLEISNMSNIPIALYPNMNICQITYFQMTTPADITYGNKKIRSHYQNQRGTTASRISTQVKDDHHISQRQIVEVELG